MSVSEIEQRVEMELTVGDVAIAISFVGAPVDCVRDIVTAVVQETISARHHRIRVEAQAEQEKSS